MKKLKLSVDAVGSSQVAPAFYLIEDIARMLGMSQRSVHRLVKAGKMPQPIKLAGSRWLREVIDQWLESGCPSCSKPAEKAASLIETAADNGHTLRTAQQVLESAVQAASAPRTKGRCRG